MKRRKSQKKRVNNKNWHHPSVLALREKFGYDLSPERVIRNLAVDKIRYACSWGWCGPPYDPRILASLHGIRVAERELKPGTDGLLYLNHRGGLEILVNAKAPKSRQNFTICHEIAHTFFPDHYEIVRMRQNKETLEEHHWELEKLCNLGASELLMPMDKFARDVVYYGFSLSSVDTLKERYSASPEAVVRRMISTELEISCAVFLRCMHKPREEKAKAAPSYSMPHKKMRVDYTVPSMDFPCFIPRFKSVPDCSCVNQALFSKKVVSATEDWGFKGGPPFRVEAQAHSSLNCGNHVEHRATALLFPSYF